MRVMRTYGVGNPCVEFNEGIEEDECPDSTEAVEHQVAECGFLGCGICSERGDNRGDGCSDIATQHHGAGKVERNPAFATHDENDGEGSR